MSDRLPWFRCFPSALLGALAGLDPDEGLVYVTALLRIYETGGPVAETGKTLSRRTGLTERRAAAALDRLIGAGKLVRAADGRLDSPSTHDEIRWQTERRGDQSSAGKASAAKRQQQASAAKNDVSGAADDKDEHQKGQQNQRDGGNARSTDDERPLNHLDQDRELEEEGDKLLPLVERPNGFPPKAFELWWLAYPHKVGKQAAERAFERIRKAGRVPWAALTDGVQRYIRTKPPDRSYCNPATWLNEGRWDDEPSTGNTGSLFAGAAAGGRRSSAGNSAVATALARHADRSGIGPGVRPDGDRPRDQGHHGSGRDDSMVEDADWTPAGGYRAAH